VTGFQPTDPGWEDRVRASFGRQGLMAHLGAELESVSPGRCSIRVVRRPELTQQHGLFHAGVIGAIADSAAGYAAMSLMPADSTVVSVEYKLNLLAPADGEAVVARAEAIRPGGMLYVCRADVCVVEEGVERLCAAAQLTMYRLRGRPETGAGG
jgi:uncharacterized protein (TIGR00369 family)